MIAVSIILPALAGLLIFFLKKDRFDFIRRFLLLAISALHLVFCAFSWFFLPEAQLTGWLVLDPLGLLFLTISSLIFFAVAIYAVGYFHSLKGLQGFMKIPEAAFTCCLLLTLSSMTLMCSSQHLGIFWISLEASTLVSAPLIYFRRSNRSLEAAWKYLMICSIGIALALLGNFFLAVAASPPGGEPFSLVVGELVKGAHSLNTIWLRAGFLFIVVGYGTKMGLVPLHTWLPDAHSEAPCAVSALLSGALLNGAFLGILRVYQVCIAADQGAFCDSLLRGFGLFSIAIAAVFILSQKDFKRMLAYSSVEHMGILALGVGMGGAATFGAMLHAVNHSLVKAMLFLLAGNVLDFYHTKKISEVTGMLRTQPATGALWVAGLFAISGFPPFGTFLSEFVVLKGAFDGGFLLEGVALLAFLSLIFIGMVSAFLPMSQGKKIVPEEGRHSYWKPSFWSIAPPLVLCCLALLIGCFLPPALQQLLHAAARSLGGS